jgi:hypothetical protein
MDCDQIFMILTRGPFPTGEDSDEEVESHLEVCSECWRLAEALRPALEVFQEAVPPAEGRDLPGYWGDARPASAAVAQLVSATKKGITAASSLPKKRNREYLPQPMARELPTEVFRAAVMAATLTGAGLAVFSFLN